MKETILFSLKFIFTNATVYACLYDSEPHVPQRAWIGSPGTRVKGVCVSYLMWALGIESGPLEDR